MSNANPPHPPPASAVVLFAHGSHDPDWAQPFRMVQARLATQRPELSVELAFLDMMQPRLPEAVRRLAAAGHERITIAPLFMAQGAHLKRDLEQIVAGLRGVHSGIEFRVLPVAGEADPVLEAIGDWLADCA